MPSALTMQVAYLQASDFADDMAEREPYDVLIERWKSRSIAYTVQAACLDEMISTVAST